jgi:uncharacterized protein YndB with AHSA1/START domain
VAGWLVRPYSPSGRAEVEARLDGKYELFWDPENPQKDSTIGCKVTALEPGKFLSFEWKGPSQFSHFMNNTDPLTHVTVFFIPIDPKTTEAHLIHTGWRDSQDWREARKYFEEAWSSAFGKLRLMVNGS